MENVFQGMQGVFWSSDVSSLDPVLDKNYIIHQVLMFGSLEHIRELESLYGWEEISRVFVEHPRPIYTHQAFHFIKIYLLGVRKHLSTAAYVKTALRSTRRPPA